MADVWTVDAEVARLFPGVSGLARIFLCQDVVAGRRGNDAGVADAEAGRRADPRSENLRFVYSYRLAYKRRRAAVRRRAR